MVPRRSGGKGAARTNSAGRQKLKRRWVARVQTNATHPPKGLFTKDASTIARSLASKKVSPKGPGSGMRMLNYFVNRAGKGLSASRRRELQRAKKLLAMHITSAKQTSHRRS
jgi:Protein of unknown function (DUF3175)